MPGVPAMNGNGGANGNGNGGAFGSSQDLQHTESLNKPKPLPATPEAPAAEVRCVYAAQCTSPRAPPWRCWRMLAPPPAPASRRRRVAPPVCHPAARLPTPPLPPASPQAQASPDSEMEDLRATLAKAKAAQAAYANFTQEQVRPRGLAGGRQEGRRRLRGGGSGC